MLLGMGDWLAMNGEAIYGTRPWLVYGEGPTRGKGGGFSEGADKPFTAQDIRFTTKGDALYAIALGWPKDEKLLIRSLAADAGKVTSVNLLGHTGALAWMQGGQGLEITLPKAKPCEHACVLKILGDALKPSPAAQVQAVARPAADGSVTLVPETAELHGTQVRVEEQHGHAYIAAWDKPEDWVSWKIAFPVPTKFEVTVIYSAAAGDTSFLLELAGHKFSGAAKQTPTWFEYGTTSIGEVVVDKAGVAEIHVRAQDTATWRALNIRDIRLTPSR